MSKTFYTSVCVYGSRIMYRGVENGRRVRHQIDYNPTLYLLSKEPTKFTTIHGDYVAETKPGNIRDCREFVEKYKDVDNFKIFGNQKYEYTFISDNFPNQIEWDIEHINVCNIDIETGSENGFPEPETASEPITAITMKTSNTFVVFGCGEFQNDRTDVRYVKCSDEIDLIKRFVDEWSGEYPDIITGWNCIPIDSYVWKLNEIVRIKNLKRGDELYDSVVNNVSPINKKPKYKILLANGTHIGSSIDHVYRVKRLSKNSYSNLLSNRKRIVDEMDCSLKDIDLEKYTYYVPLPKRDNVNVDNVEFMYEDLYIMGLCYSDGTRQKNTHSWANSIAFYNNDMNLLKYVHEYKVKNCKNKRASFEFRDSKRRVRLHVLKQSLIDLIYDGDTNVKSLNVELLSRLSKKQFMYFLSGIIDGDGSKHESGYGFVDFTQDGIEKMSVLLYWNGIFHFRHKNSIRITKYEGEELCFYTKHSNKLDDIDKFVCRKNTSSNDIKYRFIDGTYWIRIDSITNTGETVDMMDIETNTNYFVYNGVKVHNCKFFDIPYLVNRITKLMGEDFVRRLSPWNRLSERNVIIMGRNQKTYLPLGIAVLDYIELYKKFAPGGMSQESYKLDSICNVELGERKLSYEGFESRLDKLLSTKSRDVVIPENKPVSEMHEIEKWVLLKNKLKR